MFSEDLVRKAETVLTACRQQGLRLATAESCTGGLIAGLLTEIAGASDVVDRGFVVYSNAAKATVLGVSPTLIEEVGAVSEEVARAMAAGALARSAADLAVACTGIAGPGGGTEAKPVGLVHIACADRTGPIMHRRCEFGDVGRGRVRLGTVAAALALLAERLAAGDAAGRTGQPASARSRSSSVPSPPDERRSGPE